MTFFDFSAVPLSSFEGYHIGYKFVREIIPGNGYRTFTYQTEDIVTYTVFPHPPAPARILAGNLKFSRTWNASGNIIAYESHTPKNDAYTSSTDVMFKVSQLCGNFLAHYTIRTRPYREEQVTNSLDGIATTIISTYDAQNRFLFPVTRSMTNSDGKVQLTEYTYNHDYTDGAMRAELLNRFVIASPWKTSIKVNGVEVDGSEQEFAFFTNTTGAWQSGASGGSPRPYKFYNFEKTWDAGGALMGPGKTLKATINSYDGKGNPASFTTANWADPETYEWQYGQIKKRAFKDFNWEYAYYPNSRLLKSIEDIDSLKVTYTYDALMRLDSVLSRNNNIRTKYHYQYKDASNPRNFTWASTAYTPVSGSILLSRETWQYLDGLGRPTNNLKRQHHPTRGANYDIFGKVDVLTAMEYDNFGRVIKDYLPYQSAYDNGAYWPVVSGTPFTLTQYENSPLSRVTSVTPPGGYATTTTYGANTSVINVPGTSLSYPVGSLYETRVTDPDNRVKISYTDKLGREVLSRQTDSYGSSPADTYFQYDGKGRLIRVIPPGASASNVDLIYTYEYDAADRLVRKKIPGAGNQYMKYNTRDLLVFSRDSNLVSTNQSLGYKYDDYGRVLETGLVSGFPTDPNAAFSFTELQTKNFYDGYDGSTQLNLTTFPQYRGRVRRSENRVLGSTTWLHTTFTYDAYGRITQTQGNSYLNSTTANAETIVNSYDFSDFLLLSTRTHLPGSAAATGNQTIKTNYLNDHAGRKTDLLLEVGGINTHLAKYSYDFRERLIERNLHSGLYGSTWAAAKRGLRLQRPELAHCH